MTKEKKIEFTVPTQTIEIRGRQVVVRPLRVKQLLSILINIRGYKTKNDEQTTIELVTGLLDHVGECCNLKPKQIEGLLDTERTEIVQTAFGLDPNVLKKSLELLGTVAQLH
jgi:hypothetical protein